MSGVLRKKQCLTATFPLYDTPRLTRNFERLLQAMYANWPASRPGSFDLMRYSHPVGVVEFPLLG
ncbi:MAG: hypothetical protein QG599_906 [Pseudomonadota bacterium]|nr:hypothetical protein [Pseudomonadota bacterium]